MIAPANTGNDSNSKIAVNKTDHTNNGKSSIEIASPFMFKIVVIKLAEPKIDLTPAKCNEKIPRSTLAPGCPKVDRGG